MAQTLPPSLKPLISFPHSQDPVEVVSVLYDLHDAKRWIRHFVSKYHNKDLMNVTLHLEAAYESLTYSIAQYSTAIDKLSSKERALPAVKEPKECVHSRHMCNTGKIASWKENYGNEEPGVLKTQEKTSP